MAESSNSLTDAATKPKRASVDGTSVDEHSLKDQIELDRYLRAKDAQANNKPGLGSIRIGRIAPAGPRGLV